MAFLLIGSVLLAMMSTRPEAFLHGRWTPEDAMRLYGVAEWGRGYFAVNDAGRVTVHPDRDGRAPDQMASSVGAANGQAKRYVELLDIVEGLRERGLTTPVLLRFSDILRTGCASCVVLSTGRSRRTSTRDRTRACIR